ncbi:MAG TPA: GNAT family N-acetyltransferase [Myxococcota bacterium]|nr:GNAT family N-acetyltransferase [Myxococcota bacterium]
MQNIDTIRPVTAEDKSAILRMMETFNEEEFIKYSVERLGQSFDALLTNPAWGQAFIAELGGVPIGYAVLTYSFDFEYGGRDAFLTELFITPRHRGRNLGHELLGHVQAFAREQGLSALHLIVRKENPQAQRLYRRNDFQFDPRLLMTKELK